MTERRYLLHGLTVDTAIDLPHDVTAPPAGRPDLYIRAPSSGHVPNAAPPGRLLLRYPRDDVALYWVTRNGQNLHLRHPGLCDLTVDLPNGNVDLVVDPEGRGDLVPLILIGNLLTVYLEATGSLVLHASAVEFAGSALAFTGWSGQGKSTLAALLATAGHRLVTDDVLRVKLSASGSPQVYAGATRLRLREAGWELGQSLPGRGTTTDGRLALAPPPAKASLLPLLAVTVPVPRADTTRPAIEWLNGIDATKLLLMTGRMGNWQDGDLRRNRLRDCAELLAATPLGILQVPWGPPWPASLAADIAELVADGGAA